MTAPVWLFDGVCVFCMASVQYVLKHERDHTIRFVAIQSQEGRALALAHGVDPDDPQTFLFVEDGISFGKSDGVFQLLRHVGGPARAILTGRILPRAWRDALYMHFARRRYRLFGKYAQCVVPEASVRQRFVLPVVT